ncbi:hypothetical protein ACFQ61_00260 [Streptomyces sp. NPDC056500]|uniref:hypothetical protein n=1 Tax=Streptomyces sp. NPDC056500 TaxID=3345840 RepID=UPI0036CBD7B7
MTPRLRGRRCVIAVAAAMVLYAPPLAQAVEQERPAERPNPTASPTASLAGRAAGEGRTRPGRSAAEERPRTDETSAAASDSDSASVSNSDSDSATRNGSAPPTDAASQHRPNSSAPDALPAISADPSGPLPEEDMAPEAEEPGTAMDDPRGTGAPAAARQHPGQTVPAPTAQQISPLSLGIGMALMGLGIGFLGVRMRRR